jgi:hypothetical protein
MDDKKALDNLDIDGQMSIDDFLSVEPPSEIIAVSRIFARAIKQMNLAEWKTFVYALTRIRWTEKNKNIVYLDKQTVAKLVGVGSDSDHLSVDLKRSIGELPTHSFISIDVPDKDYFDNGVFITRVTMLKNRIKIKFEEDYMPLFEELNKERNYITMWSDDLFQMSSERSILMYESLRLHSDTNRQNSRIYTTREIKELFGLPKDGKGSYIKSNGHFDRTNFEKKVLLPICEDLKKCTMLNLEIPEDGQGYWRKIKKHGYVVGYQFFWTISTHPRVVSAKDVSLLNQDPTLLKVASDIVKSKKKKPQKTENMENSHNYDMDELERKLLQ